MDINIYKERIEKYMGLKKEYKQKNNFYILLRLLTFIGASVLIYFSYKINNYKMTIVVVLGFMALFSFLTNLHGKVKHRLKKIEISIELNNKNISREKHKIKEFDSGDDLLEVDHNYLKDLDIIGENSIFQWISSAITPMGRKTLKDELSGKIKFSKKEIDSRQRNIEELSNNYIFYEKFLVEGLVDKISFKDPKGLLLWFEKVQEKYLSKKWYIISNISNVLLVISIILPLISSNYSFTFFKIIIAVNIGLILYDINHRNENLQQVFVYRKDIDKYNNMISCIQDTEFKEDGLKNLKKKLYDLKGDCITENLREFSNLANKISDRQNIFYWVMNILFLWDYKVNYKLENFKLEGYDKIKNMLQVISQFEALLSFSNINRDNKDWVIPKIEEGIVGITAKNMAHPLIFEGAVPNDIVLNGKNKIYLITGSNMAGKSTLLRTTGVNLVLAYCGAKVKAKEFQCGLMEIFTLMRTSDNLEESISSFYAEILRVKKLINISNEGRPMFFLVDEIFKGTNSIDRHTGASMLIDQLSKKNLCGMVSTHDLELGEIENHNSFVKNHHFEEYYKEDKLLFDYKLRPGVSTTRNAIYLMKMAGIKL